MIQDTLGTKLKFAAMKPKKTGLGQCKMKLHRRLQMQITNLFL
jgi:hypothetical protein